MAAFSANDVPTQPAALLGRDAVQIRTKDESPRQILVIDMVAPTTGQTQNNSAVALKRLQQDHPDVTANSNYVKSPYCLERKGHRTTPVTDVQGIVEVLMLLPGRQASCIQRQAAELLCNWLGGSFTIIDMVCRNRSLQENLAVENPRNARRLFGEAVEAAGSPITRGSQTTGAELRRQPPNPPQSEWKVIPSGLLFRLDDYCECIVIPWVLLQFEIRIQQTRVRSDSASAGSIDCFGGSLYLLSKSQCGAACKDHQEHPRAVQEHPKERLQHKEHPKTPREHP